MGQLSSGVFPQGSEGEEESGCSTAVTSYHLSVMSGEKRSRDVDVWIAMAGRTSLGIDCIEFTMTHDGL